MKRNILFIIAFLGIISSISAQRVSSKLIEFPIDSNVGSNYKIYSLGERGAVLLLRSQNIEKGQIDFVFSILDKNLNQEWSRAYPLKYTTVVIDHYLTEDFLYLLVSSKETKYDILQLNLKNRELNLIEYENIKDYFITQFKVEGDLCFFGGIIKTYPAVIGYNIKTGRKIILSSVNQLKANLVDLEVDKTDEVVSVVLFQNSPSSKRGLYINRYDFNGKLISNFFFKTEPGFKFLSYRALILNAFETLFIGTYALKGSDEAHGIYTMKVRGKETVFLKKHPFVEMDNFVKFLRERQQNKILEKVTQQGKNDKPLNYSYDAFFQSLTFNGDEIVTTTDIYDTKLDRGGVIDFIEEGNSFAGYGSRLDPSMDRFVRANYNFKEFTPANIPIERLNPNKPFPAEFDYLSTFTSAFNIDGDFLWGNTFSFDDGISSFIPMHMTRVAPQQDSLIMGRLIYTEDNIEEFRFKVTGYESYLDSATVTELPVFIEGDKIDSYDYGGLLHWHDNNFLSLGIKNVNNNGLRREVFFIRKITCKPQ